MSEPYVLPIVLQIAGVILIIAEIILPSGGILSILAAGALIFSLVKAFSISTNTGVLFIAADTIMIPALVLIGLKLIAKSPVTLKRSLSREEGVISQKNDMNLMLDATGIAMTDLRPSGGVSINNKRTDVVTQGEYIDKGTTVRVIQITGNQIIVKAE